MYSEITNSQEVIALTAKLDKAIKDQEMMKETNKIIKKSKGADCTAALVAIGLSETDARTKQRPDFANRIGFPAYKLTNNNADIKRWTAKLKELQGKENINSGETKEVTFEGGKVVYNVEVDRLQIIHDEKPDEDARRKLKQAGFIWSPRFTAWQRQLTNNACRSAEYLLGVHVPPVSKIETLG